MQSHELHIRHLRGFVNHGEHIAHRDAEFILCEACGDVGMCIICVVGDLDWSNIGFETLALDALKDIPVRMVSYGGSNYNISFLIREEDKKRALQKLSDTIFK